MEAPAGYSNEISQKDYERKMKFDSMLMKAKIQLASLPYIGNPQKAFGEFKKLKAANMSYEILVDVLGYFRVHN